jgi:hypothetical protein
MNVNRKKFCNELVGMGIVGASEQESLFQIALRCSKTVGLSAGLGGAAMGTKAGTVTWPGVGTISGAVAGFLSGLLGGTATCTMANRAMRDELLKLARQCRGNGRQPLGSTK